MKKLNGNGELVDMTQQEIDAHNSAILETDEKFNSYYALRAGAYLPITEQLDMLYKDMQNGTTLWQDHITTVKNTYPKP